MARQLLGQQLKVFIVKTLYNIKQKGTLSKHNGNKID